MTDLQMSVEHYARCTVTAHGLTVEPGMELREGDDFAAMTTDLRQWAEWAASLGALFSSSGRAEMCKTLETSAVKRWPDRAWFVEVFDEHGNWSQSYCPFGTPRWR